MRDLAELLPLELILRIFESCSDEDTLRSCCTVCRAWLPLCQPLLFERATVFLAEQSPSPLSSYSQVQRRSSQQLVSFIQLADSGSMRRIIKNIDVVFDAESELTSLRAIFHFLENIESLMLLSQYPRMISPSPFFPASIATLTRLVLINVGVEQFDKEMSSLPNLCQLSLEAVIFSDWSQTLARPPQLLQALSAYNTRQSFEDLVEHFLPHMTALRRLVVHNIFDEQHLSSDALDRLIASNTETLEHLATHHLVTFLPLPRLRTLSLSSGRDVDVFLTYVHDTLMSIRSTTTLMLDELVLRIAPYSMSQLPSHSAQWEGLQDLILSVARQCRIELCTVSNVSPENLSQYVTASDLQAHPSFERLRTTRRITFVGQDIRDFEKMEE